MILQLALLPAFTSSNPISILLKTTAISIIIIFSRTFFLSTTTTTTRSYSCCYGYHHSSSLLPLFVTTRRRMGPRQQQLQQRRSSPRLALLSTSAAASTTSRSTILQQQQQRQITSTSSLDIMASSAEKAASSSSSSGKNNNKNSNKNNKIPPLTPPSAGRNSKKRRQTQSPNAAATTPTSSSSDNNATKIPSSSSSSSAAAVASAAVVSPEQVTSTSSDGLIIYQDDGYEDLNVKFDELRPSATLTTGQCFHWKAVVKRPTTSTSTSTMSGESMEEAPMKSKKKKKVSAWGSHNATEWIGTLRDYDTSSTESSSNSIVLSIRETPTTTLYRVLYKPPEYSSDRIRQFLYSYFQLTSRPSLKELYDQWSDECGRLSRIAKCIPGVRIISQDPFETLISFICSSNNNIPRITKMLNAIRKQYGEELITTAAISGEGEGEDNDYETFYSFPSLQTLVDNATEQDLRQECGLGYRAKYIMETIHKLDELGGEEYLHQIKNEQEQQIQEELGRRHRYRRSKKESEDDDSPGAATSGSSVKEKLIQFTGVGPKVADCVALFSLKQDDAIPVDVHVWNIARRDYDDDGQLASMKSSNLTPTTYKQVGDIFRNRFPVKSGWAHSLLFVAELPSFREALPDDIVREMDAFREEEKARKKQKKR